MIPNNPEQMKPELSNCCKAPIKATHGCDDDFLHGGKKCTCEIVTSWYVCEKCKHPCDPLVAEMVEVSKIGTDSPVFTKAFQERLKPECQLCKKPVNYAEAALYKGDWYCRECTLPSPDTLNTCQKHVKTVHVEPTESWEETLKNHLKNYAAVPGKNLYRVQHIEPFIKAQRQSEYERGKRERTEEILGDTEFWESQMKDPRSANMIDYVARQIKETFTPESHD